MNQPASTPFTSFLQRTTGRSLLTAFAVGLLLACQGSTGSQVHDSNSNWLKECDTDAECGGSLSCVHARCVPACSDNTDCAGRASECRSLVTVAGCAKPADGAGYCLSECANDDECSEVAAGLTCEQGVCVPQPSTCEPAGSPSATGGPSATANPSVTASSEPNADAGAQTSEPSPTESDPNSTVTLDGGSPPSATGSDSELPVGDGGLFCQLVSPACPAGCTAISARGLRAGSDCFDSEPTTLGCHEPGLEQTTDDNCVTDRDGTIYVGVSGTFVGGFVRSGAFSVCTNEELELSSNVTQTCEPEQPECVLIGCVTGENCCTGDGLDAGVDVDASDVLPVNYSAELTGGIGCCDLYTLVKSDPAQNLCVFVEISDEVGDEPPRITATSVSDHAADCWSMWQQATPLEQPAQGEVELRLEEGWLLDAELTLLFSELENLPEQSAAISVSDLPVDGAWYPPLQ